MNFRPETIQIACLLVACIASGCANEPAGPKTPGPQPGSQDPILEIEIEPSKLSFGAIGSSLELHATVTDDDGHVVTGAEVKWFSSAPTVVAVDSMTGLSTSEGNGTATLSAVSGDAVATIEAAVEQIPVDMRLTVDVTEFRRVGQIGRASMAAADSNGNAVSKIAADFATSEPGVVVVDATGEMTAVGPGTAKITATSNAEETSVEVTVRIEGPLGGALLGSVRPCEGGFVGPFPCRGFELLAYLPIAGLGGGPGIELNDIWGWIDPVTGDRWALVGRMDGLAFVRVTDPLNPRTLGFLPAADAPTYWRDVKVYANHAYVVADGSPSHGIQVFDLTRLRDVEVFETFSVDARYTRLGSIHNLAIDEETGFAYAVGAHGTADSCGGGLHMIDLANPESPAFAGCFADPQTGIHRTGYVHDVRCVVYEGPDPDYSGHEICFGANETAISIVDVSRKSSPHSVATAGYPNVNYVHQGWLTEDQRYFITNDELDEVSGGESATRMFVWDVTDLDDPVLSRIHYGPTSAIDHNVFIVGGIAWQSNYNYGLRAVDVTDPKNPVERAWIDTHPQDDDQWFDGTWSNYPFFGDGIVLVTSATEGLFVLRLTG
ncbi:MAG: choice-of-anchor B family protein [Gemmatimonadales bacterium]|jgi:choice-of-anchor B domain-containing protein